MRRKIFAVIMSLTLILTLIPAMVYADAPEAAEKAAQEETSSQDEQNDPEQSNSEQSKPVIKEHRRFFIDSPEKNVLLFANSTVGYEPYDLYRTTPVQIYLQNINQNESEVLSFCVVNKDGEIKSSISAEDMFNNAAGNNETESVYILKGREWIIRLYYLAPGDQIVIMSGDSKITFSMMVQQLSRQGPYRYGYHEKTSFGYVSRSAQLIHIEINPSAVHDVVLFLGNDEDIEDFSYCILSRNGEIVNDVDGNGYYTLEGDDYRDTAYSLVDNDYYLLLFNIPGQCMAQAHYKDFRNFYDEDLASGYGMCISPRDLKYYKVSGICNKIFYDIYHTQTFEVGIDDLILIPDEEFTTTYSNNYNVGTATVTITANKPFTGTIVKTFTIKPNFTYIKKLTGAKRAFTVKWVKQSSRMSRSRINSYQEQYSTRKNFTSARSKIINGYKNTSKKISGLKRNTTYYVRIRTRMKVDGKWYYSNWSETKKVKTK